MNLQATLQKVDDSLGLLLPDEVIKYLGKSEGESLFLTMATDGSLVISPNRSLAAGKADNDGEE